MNNDASRNSRLSGWRRLSVMERRKQLGQWFGIGRGEELEALSTGGLSIEEAELLIENVTGLYALPFSIAPNFTINGKDYLVPMVIEEASVVAAASNAARIAREGGGFTAKAGKPVMICQIQLFASDLDDAGIKIEKEKKNLLEAASEADDILVKHGGGPVDIELRSFDGETPDDNFLVIHLLVDVRDAMGANSVNTMGETIAPIIEGLTGGRCGLCILSNLADRRLVTVEAKIPSSALEMTDYSGDEVVDGIVSASRFAEIDRYRAATHNKGVMNGIDAVLLATGNDFRAVEAGAHAFAARNGVYKPISTWRREGGFLHGCLTLPMAVGIIGGATRVHKCAGLALDLIEAETAADLAIVAVSAGLATNLASLRALATEGIQKGHMRLHKRSRGLLD